jgi:FecR protein
MNSPRYARIAARLFAQAPAAEVESANDNRAQTIDAIARAIVAKKRRATRRLLGWGVSAAAAAALIGYGGFRQRAEWARGARAQTISAVVRPSGNGAAIVNGLGSEPLVGAASLAQGGRLVAGTSGGATVRLSTGTELAVLHDTNVEFESAGPVEQFFLTHGVLRAKVAKLGNGERFIVRTPDAEVEVRGTVFEVAIVDPDTRCGGGSRTRVSVSEGVVQVRRAGVTSAVHPGEVWPAGCDAAAPVPSLAIHVAPLARRSPVSTPVDRARSAAEAQEEAAPAQNPTKEASSIAQQNELFSVASSAHQRGDDARALRTFDQLIAHYPASPLAESAAVQRMHLLRSSDPVAAQNAARQYLARYPQGYARNDAQSLLELP